jgi:hypothetical protein
MENRPSPVCISVKKFLEMEERLKQADSIITNLEKEIIQLREDVDYWKTKNE